MSDNPASVGLIFLSWYRTGLSAGVAAPAGGAPLDTPPPAAVVVPVSTTIRDPDNAAAPDDTANASIQIRLHAPGDVTGLDPAQIIRIYPTANATNVEPDAFPLIEFARPDIPWMMSPTGPQTNQPTDGDPRRGLMPWLALVVVPDQPLTPPAEHGALPTLTVIDSELPDPATAWLWAHAQVTSLSTDTDPIPVIVAQSPERGLCRLMAPRYLKPNMPYLACVVPTFDTTPGAGPTLGHAWGHANPPAPQTLAVYYSWRFTTGDGDFRTYVEGLKHWDQGGVGIRPLEIGQAGDGRFGPPAGQPPWMIKLEGCLVSADVEGEIGSWSDPDIKAAIQNALAAELGGADGEDTQNNGREAPPPKGGELTPPRYGTVQASYEGQFAGGQGPTWLRTLNLDPRYRAAASLGAELVRANQEALILSAWEQAGQIDAANLVLRQGQLAREAGLRTYTRRIGAAGAPNTPLDDDRLLQITRPVHGQLLAPSSAAMAESRATIRDALSGRPAVAAAVSVPFRRMARPRGPLAARLGAAPLPAPVGNLAKADGIVPTPPLMAVPGMVDLPRVSQKGATPERLGSLTKERVATTRFPWEQATGAAIRPTADQNDTLLQPGYLADLWVLGSSMGRALDWNGTALDGWAPGPPISQATMGTINFPGEVARGWYSPPRIEGGAGSLITWNEPGTLPDPGVALVSSRVNVVDPSGQGFFEEYEVSINCVLRGDLIPSVQNSPIKEVTIPVVGEITWPTVDVGTFGWSPGRSDSGPNPLPPLRIGMAIGAGDLTGTGKPSVAVAWSVDCPGAPEAGVHVKILLDIDVQANARSMIETKVTAGQPDVQGVALANKRLFVLTGRQLLSAPVDGVMGTIGQFTFWPAWDQTQPQNWVTATLTAADFSGSGRADLLFFYVSVIPGEKGAAAYRASYRIAYELDDAGLPAYWSDEIEAPIPVSDQPTSLVLGPLDAGTSALRRTTTQAFRAAATATQARLSSVIPAVASPPPPPPIDIASLASVVRTAVDPSVTVPASVEERLSLPGGPKAAAADQTPPDDPLNSIAFTPSFPQAFYETVRDAALWRLIPGFSSLPDEAITVLGTNSHVVEAILVGANHELSRELLWRGVPALRTGTYFTRFWDRRDSSGGPLPDITEISSSWNTADLGSHAPPTTASGDLTVLLLRGELIRRFPHATIYAAPAIAAGSTVDPTQPVKRTVDLTHPIQPLFSGTLGEDSAFIGFPFAVQSAMSGPDSLGMYFIFQEHPMAPRFGLNLDDGPPSSFGGKPTAWRNLSWSEAVTDQAAYDALTYLDPSSNSPLFGMTLKDIDNGTVDHRWAFSSAHMAHITFRPPVLIAVHADELLRSPPATQKTFAAEVSR